MLLHVGGPADHAADHELAASTLAARVAASTRAPVYAAVCAGLGAMQGPRHGAASLWAEDVLAELEAGATPERAVSRTSQVEALLAFREAHELPPPSAELALGALAHCWRLVRGSGQAIFAVARTAGWVAHALEEYADSSRYRIRATYTGPAPTA